MIIVTYVSSGAEIHLKHARIRLYMEIISTMMHYILKVHSQVYNLADEIGIFPRNGGVDD